MKGINRVEEKDWRAYMKICKECYEEYKNTIAGQGFTKYVCEKCGQIAWYHNTNVPKYCSYCCEENDICERCGKSLITEAIDEVLRDMGTRKGLNKISEETELSDFTILKFRKGGNVKGSTRKKLRKWYRDRNER